MERILIQIDHLKSWRTRDMDHSKYLKLLVQMPINSNFLPTGKSIQSLILSSLGLINQTLLIDLLPIPDLYPLLLIMSQSMPLNIFWIVDCTRESYSTWSNGRGIQRRRVLGNQFLNCIELVEKLKTFIESIHLLPEGSLLLHLKDCSSLHM